MKIRYKRNRIGENIDVKLFAEDGVLIFVFTDGRRY